MNIGMNCFTKLYLRVNTMGFVLYTLDLISGA